MRVSAYNVDSRYTVTNHNAQFIEGILHWSSGRELIYSWRLLTGSRNYLMCPYWRHMVTHNLVNIASGHDLLSGPHFTNMV